MDVTEGLDKGDKPAVDEMSAAQQKLHRDFQPMQFSAQQVTLPEGRYRVYRTASDYEEVSAGSAYEAMQITDIRAPYKIVRHSLSRMAVLTHDVFNQQNKESFAETVINPDSVKDEEAEEKPIPVVKPTVEEAAERELDDAEVDALLADKTDDEQE